MRLEDINNKYKKWYYRIINYRKNNPIIGKYTEEHHIVPQSLGGLNNPNNLVKLTAREHYICHLLLTSIFPSHTVEYKKMWKAFGMMAWCKSKIQQRYYKLNNRIYEKLKIEWRRIMSSEQSGNGNVSYGKKWYYNMELKQSKKLSPQSVKSGWREGRIINWNSIEEKINTPKYRPLSKDNVSNSAVEKIRTANGVAYNICPICNTTFAMASSKHKYCSKTCINKSKFKNETKMILLEKNGKFKFTKRQNLNAYKKSGWILNENGTPGGI